MANPKLSPCPFCGHIPEDWQDFLHPTGGGWREDVFGGQLRRHYMRRDDPRGIHGEVWELGCLTHEGGCGATVSADSRDEAIAAWNRRPGQPSDLLAGQAEKAGLTPPAPPATDEERARKRATRQSVLSLSEAARCLGVGQAKNDQGAIDYWAVETTKYEETLSLALHSEETVAVQQAWEWAGGNPGIKVSREDLEQALRDLDAVRDETHQGGSSSNRPAPPARAPLDSAQLDLLVEAARAREEGGTVLCGGEAEPQVAVAEKPRPWPKDSVDQVRAVADVLAASPDPLSTAEIAARFTAKGRWKERLPKLLEMLVALGTAQELDGKFSA